MSLSTRKLVPTLPESEAPSLPPGGFEKNAKWPALQSLELPLTVRIPLQRLKLRDLRALTPGMILSSDWATAEEVPLYAADVVLSWCEFAVVEGTMAARLTRLG